uniref:E-beta-farnesene synthase n=1 Tax=Tanacetum cinerariifolium TaxID=118510 RepID=A0A6L2LTU7_TANCI|nr:E-beta-farnesene synthase [Tanacetum cinerariifolium]
MGGGFIYFCFFNGPGLELLGLSPDTRDWSQSNPILKIAVDILKNTNFFRLSLLPRQFYQSIFSRDALLITPVDNNNALSSPPTPDALINFRVLTTIINLCLTRKSSGFERLRAPVLQILWGIVNRAHIDYAEMIWEEFTQSIHTFIENKKNLSHDTQGKKKATFIVIPSVRFTKMIIYYLQSKHKFHPRPDSSLHLPNEEPGLGYLMFSAKGTKRKVFGIPISNKLITADIRGEQYYKEYLEKVAKHQRYLSSEERSDPDSPAPKPAKSAKTSNPSAPKAAPVTKPAAAKASKSISSQQPKPKPKPAPAKSQEKKHKLVTKTSDKPSLAKRSKPGLVTKRRKPTSSLRSVDKSTDEGIPEKESRFDDEEADIQMAMEERLKSVHDAPRGPLLPVVIREPDSGKFQPLPEVQGKGKEKRRTPTKTEPSGHAKSPSIYAVLGLTDNDSKSNDEVPHVVEVGAQDKGQAGPNPGVLTEGQTGLDPGDDAEPQPQSRFTAIAYPNVQDNLKLTVEEHVILEEPASFTGTLSSLQHLAKEFSFGDLFINDKPSEAKNEKTNAETEAESMVFVKIQQDTFAIPPMTTPVIDLTSRTDSPNVHRPLQTMETKTTMTTTTTTTHPPPPQPQRSTTDSMLIKRIGELEKIMANLIQDNNHLEERKKKKRHDSPKTPSGSQPHQPPPPPPPAGPSRTSRSPRDFGSSQLPSVPPPLSTNQEGQSHGSTTSSSSKIAASTEYTDIPATPELAWSIPSSDLPVPTNNWASALASTYTPPPENLLLAQTGDMEMFMDWFCKRQGIPELKQPDLEGPAFELVRAFHPNVIHHQYQMEECHKLLTDSVDGSIIRHNVSKPLPLGGPPGQVTIQSDFFFNKDLEYLRYGSKGGRPALSISKMKATYYPDVFLEQMVPDHIHTSKGDHRAIRTHMRILSVVRIKVFSMYGYDYMKKINLQGHLNHLPPKDKKILTTAVNLWTRHLVIRQHGEDFQLGIKSYQTQLNLIKPRWDATGFEYRHDFMIIDSPRAITFRDKYEVQMIMRFNEIHKFSDGTLHQIDEALDYRVKEFKVNKMNPGLNTRFWTMKDVDRSKEFMFSIQKWLMTRRIFCNLESFIGGRSAPASDHLNQNTLLSLEPRDHPKNLIRTLYHYACFFKHYENEDGNPARANI